MTTATPTRAGRPSEIMALRAHVGVELVTPADANWDEARAAWNLTVDQRPTAVAFPETAEQIQAIVEYAIAHDLRVAPQGTGHNAAAIESLTGTILVKTERMRDVTIDPAARIARVGAGALWMDVTAPAAKHGLAALAGSSPDVGVVGYTLGGGVSWLARKHGLAANHVTAIELVNADGDLIRVDAHNEPDLFWALRGGGGSFGIVTALEFRLFPITHVYAGQLMFPIERSSEVLHAWRAWTESVPDEVTSIGRILRLPPIPDIPEPLRGRAFAVVEAAMLMDEADGARLIEPLRALGPEIDTFATIPAPALSKLHMDPEHPVPGAGDHMMVRELPPAAIDALVEVAGRADRRTPLLAVDLRHFGGAIARPDASHGALGSIDHPYALFMVGVAMTPELKDAIRAFTPVVKRALVDYDAGTVYSNFMELPTDTSKMFGAGAYRRLRELKRRYDPCDRFRSNHPIPAAR